MIFHGGDDPVEESEVTVVQAQPTRELPNPFDGVEFRAVGWQEVQAELGSLLITPLQMEFGAVILRVVAYGQYATAGNSARFAEHFQELPEGLSVESPRLAAKQKRAVPQADCGEVADAFPGRMMVHNRVSRFRRYPHAATGSLLLKVHFVQRPEVDRIVPY